MGLLNFLKKGRHERKKVEQPLPDLPPVDTPPQNTPQSAPAEQPPIEPIPQPSESVPAPGPVASPEPTPNTTPTSDLPPLPSESAQKPTPEPPAVEQPPVESRTGQEPAHAAQESDNPTPGFTSSAEVTPEPTPEASVDAQAAPQAAASDMQNILAGQSAPAAPQEDSLRAPSFAIPDNPGELTPEEVYISKPRYVSFLGNIQSLKKQLEHQNEKSVSYDQYVDILKKGIQESLAAEDLLKKVEEQIQF